MKAKRQFKVQIPEPCHEKWSEMTAAEKGRHCASCDKTVIDFSVMTDRQIIEFLDKQSKGSTCGRLKSSQVNRELIHSAARPGPSKSAIYMMLFGGLLASGAAQGQACPPPPLMGDTILVERPMILGRIAAPVIDDKAELGEVVIEETITISGSVKDEYGEPILYGNVHVQGTQIGTTTDIDGNYSLEVPLDYVDSMLVFSYIGFSNATHRINPERKKLDVKLKENPHLIGEIIIVEKRTHKYYLTRLVDKLPALKFNIVFKKKKKRKKVKMKQTDPSVHLIPTEVKPIPEEHPFVLVEKTKLRVFPNPFADYLKMEVEIPKTGKYKIQLISISGQSVFQVEENFKEGQLIYEIDASSLDHIASGNYILHLEGNEFSESISVVYTKGA